MCGLRRPRVRFGFGHGRNHLRLCISPMLSHRYLVAYIADLSVNLEKPGLDWIPHLDFEIPKRKL